MKLPMMVAAIGALVGQQAFAHVTISPHEAKAGGYAKLDFRVPHGCDGAATTEVRVQIPKGVTSVKPQVHPGWTIQIKKAATPAASHGDDAAVSEIVWTGGRLPDEYMDEFGLSVKLPDGPTGSLAFPVVQICEKGEARWTDVTEHKGAHHHGSKGEASGAPLPAPRIDLKPKA